MQETQTMDFHILGFHIEGKDKTENTYKKTD